MTPKNDAKHMNNEAANGSLSANSHSAAANAFVDRGQSQHGDKLAELYAFGSTVRGESHSLTSDIDVLVVFDTTANRKSTAEAPCDLAYDVMSEYGSVVELHIHSISTFEQSQEQSNPYIRNILREVCSYV